MEERFNFNLILNSFIILIPINIFILAVMTVYRFIFFLFFADFSTVLTMKMYILKAFWMGCRFDLSVLAYVNAPITLFFLICFILQSEFIFRFIVSFVKYYYSLIFPLIFLLFFIDSGFYICFKDHYNLMIFGLFEDDTLALVKTMIVDYRFWLGVIAFLFLACIIVRFVLFTVKTLKNNERIVNTLYWAKSKKFFAILFIAALNFIAARGSFSMFPLGLFYSQISPDQFINKLCVNPIHPLADTVYLKIKNFSNSVDLKESLKYDDTNILNDLKIIPAYQDAVSVQDIYNKTTKENKLLDKNKPNVILIVMEGFGEVPVLNNNPKFNVLGELKQHFDKDIVFYNFIAAGFITIHAIESVTLNIPQRPFVNQITQSQAAYKQQAGSMVLPYKNAGYRTSALYGGSMTWRDLEGFFKAQGFDDILGEGNIKTEAKDRHSWGINDDKLFEEQLFNEEIKEPKFIFAMTTQTHPPYKVAPEYEPLPLEIPANIAKMMSLKDLHNENLFKVYQSTNRELAKFISDIKNSKFADNTIIAVTGDHNLRELSNVTPEEYFIRYAVPFYLYIPEKLKGILNTQERNSLVINNGDKNSKNKRDIRLLRLPVKENKKFTDFSVFGSQMDIMPTLYGLSLSAADYVSLGNNLFTTHGNVALNIDGLVLKDNIAVKYNFIDGTFMSFIFDDKSKKLTQVPETENHRKLVNYYKAVMVLTDKEIIN